MTVLPGQVLRVQYEEVVADLETQVRRILAFCELPFRGGVCPFPRDQTVCANRELGAGEAAHLQWFSADLEALWRASRRPQGDPRAGRSPRYRRRCSTMTDLAA